MSGGRTEIESLQRFFHVARLGDDWLSGVLLIFVLVRYIRIRFFAACAYA